MYDPDSMFFDPYGEADTLMTDEGGEPLRGEEIYVTGGEGSGGGGSTGTAGGSGGAVPTVTTALPPVPAGGNGVTVPGPTTLPPVLEASPTIAPTKVGAWVLLYAGLAYLLLKYGGR